MHRLERPEAPESFLAAYAAFVRQYPPQTEGRTENKRWEAWKNEYQQAYRDVCKVLYENQNGLCAFCEIKLAANNRQIEHFIPKSLTTTEQDWTIRFENYTMSCKGNENKNDTYYSSEPSEGENYTCGHKKDNLDPVGKICCPYDLPVFPVIKNDYHENGLFFIPDGDACQRAGISEELVRSTLENLGLNCPNLRRRRKAVWDELMQDIESIYKDIDEDKQDSELQSLASENLEPRDGVRHGFYTTRLLCLANDIPSLIEGYPHVPDQNA